MAHVVVTASADRDTDEIIAYLAGGADARRCRNTCACSIRSTTDYGSFPARGIRAQSWTDSAHCDRAPIRDDLRMGRGGRHRDRASDHSWQSPDHEEGGAWVRAPSRSSWAPDEAVVAEST